MAKKPSGYSVGNVKYGRFTNVNPKSAANQNETIRQRVDRLKSLTAETDKMLKSDKSYKLNSGKAAYGTPKASGPSVASRIAGAAGRFAGPFGALVGMTTPAGSGSDKPPKGIKGMSQRDQAAANEATSAKRPTSSSLNAPARTKPSGSARPTSNNLSAPARTSYSSGGPKTTSSSSSGSMRSGPGSTGGSKTSSSSGGMRSGPGSTGGSKTTSSSSGSASRSTGPSRGPTSSPSRTEPSRANLGTSRFSKGGAIKRRMKKK
jgi:hypothetical protein